MDKTKELIKLLKDIFKHGHPQFYELLIKMAQIHDEKNSDYAKLDEPFSNFKRCEEFSVQSWIGSMVRMSDKWSRLVELTRKYQEGKGPTVKDESLKDTLIDLANYSLICYILFEEAEDQKI